MGKRAEEADGQYDEAQKKMQVAEASLEVNGERADVSEFKIIELEEELKVVANNLKSLEVSEDKANQRESFYKREIKRLTTKLKQSETRSEFAEKSVVKLQKEVDRLEDELVNEQDKFKASPRSWTPPLPRCPATKPRCLATCCPPTRSNFFATELNDTWLPPCCAPQFSINSSKSIFLLWNISFRACKFVY